MRECIVLATPRRGGAGEFVRHLAVGRKTLCSIELGGAIPDPPGFSRDTARPCEHPLCARRRCSSCGQFGHDASDHWDPHDVA